MKKQITLNPPLQRGKLLNSPLFKGGAGGICSKAFTLIEVMVVMAIISILAAILMPVTSSFFESEERATTRQRMNDLRIAMVGDRNLVQNGARTHFGYVGDHGVLPVQDQLSSVRRYLPAGSDPNTYNKDAWGNLLVYDPSIFPAKIKSYGPNGIADDSDDIEMVPPIEESEVTPLTTIKGNNPTLNKGLKLLMSPEKTGAFASIETDCIDVASPPYTLTLPNKVPIGRIVISMKTYSETDCTTYLNTYSFIHIVNDQEQVILLPDLR